MAEPVYKKITELDVLSTAIDGSETLPIVKAGKTYRRTLANLFGTGWITSLLGAFTAFKAPDATHADDADTVGGEDNAALHNAALLTGNINLDRIPAELTGKNAATATVSAACSGNAASATTSAACSGNAASATKWGAAGLKVAVLTGTSPAVNVAASIDISSITTSDKIISFNCIIGDAYGYYAVPFSLGFEYTIYASPTNVITLGVRDSRSANRPYKLTIIYTD